MNKYNYILDKKQANKATTEEINAYLKSGHFLEKFKSKYLKILDKKKN